MPASFDYPSYWRFEEAMPEHWKGCLYTWLYSGTKTIHSQCGQDLVVEFITPPDSNRLFLDLGANDGITGSSTFQLRNMAGEDCLLNQV